jgi:elongator complex protein 3
MTPNEDVNDFKKLFNDSNLKPDMLKIYPSLVLKNTPLYNDYLEKKYKPYTDEEMLHVLTEAKKMVPKWVRIMRVQREITPGEIQAGPKAGNLRQIVHKRLKDEGFSCKCIRCREAGLSRKNTPSELLKLGKEEYDSSNGRETFISFDDEDETIYGFLRLRKPSELAHRDEITSNSCIVRELHVFGKSIKIGEHEENSIQHSGLGRKLMDEAEKISKENFDAKKLLVISAVGTREYYKKLGYSLDGPYVSKQLR